MQIRVNGEPIDLSRYGPYHRRRFDMTLALLRDIGGGRVIELGGHPWAMTARLLREPGVDLVATVSAEEVTAWPDEVPIEKRHYEIELEDGMRGTFVNYSANLERSIFDIDGQADVVLACEIIEHMTRSPHIMLLNINRWLVPGGRLVVTTPNGTQLENPFRVRPKMPAFRYSSYSRHNYVFSMDGLIDLIEICGFTVERAEYWTPYRRKGASDLYRGLSLIGNRYMKTKFAQCLCVVARKVEDRDAANRLPKAYVPNVDWERIAAADETT